MNYFDLHCDTLWACHQKDASLFGNDLCVDLQKTKSFHTYVQCCAAWIPDTYRGEDAFTYFKAIYAHLDQTLRCSNAATLENLNQVGGIGLIPTVEGGSVLAGNLAHISDLAQMGVRMLTLTWNANNEIGGGVGGGDQGLTDFGRQVLPLLEFEGILIDISHASPKLFEDVCAVTQKPFVASHSNAKALCGHQRNLTDEQIREISRRGGLIGINFFTEFLDNDPQNASIDRIADHVKYMLSLGAENTLAFGSDFDGADLPMEIKGIASIPLIYQRLCGRGHTEAQLAKIFYRNAYDFMLQALR